MSRNFVKDDSFSSDEDNNNSKPSSQDVDDTKDNKKPNNDISTITQSQSQSHHGILSTNSSLQSSFGSTISTSISSYNQSNMSILSNEFSIKLEDVNQSLEQQQSSQKQSKPSLRIMKPYDYQTAIFKKAKERNSIIYMETGKGKTYIAIMLIADLLGINLAQDLNDQKSNGKKVVFLVCDSGLIAQQIETIKMNTQCHVSSLQGKKGKKTKTDYQEFRELYKSTDIFVAIPDVLYRLLSIGFMKISDIDMLVFDECHHTNSNHTYNIIMNEFYFFYRNENKEKHIKLPRIIGLTASPLKTKIEEDIELTAKKAFVILSENLDAQVIIDPEMKEELNVNDDDSINNKEYIEIQGHLEHKSFKDIYCVIRKFFLIPYLDTALTTLNQDIKTDKIKEEYMNFIDKKFFSNDLSDYNKILSQYKHLYDIRNTSALFRVFEKMQRQLFMLFQSLNLSSFERFFSLYQLLYFTKKNQDEKLLSNDSYQNGELLTSFDMSLSLDFNSYNKQEMAPIYEVLNTTIKAIKIISNAKPEIYEADRLHKLTQSIDYILGNDPNSKIIIFVSNRIVAYFLEVIINKHLENQTNSPKKFKSISVIGINKRKTENQSLFDPKNSLKDLNNRIRMFNCDEANILIGTSTVEEGLDVQKCNVVMVFTELNTSKSYIQMKGRARKKNAKFLAFTNSINKTMTNIGNFIHLTKCMRNLFTDDIIKDFRQKDYIQRKSIGLYYYIKETEAKLTLRNVTTILNELLQLLANKMKIKVVKTINETKEKNEPGQRCFYCIMHVSDGWFGDGLKIKSACYNDKQSAESDCDMTLIKILHHKSKVDNHFKLIK